MVYSNGIHKVPKTVLPDFEYLTGPVCLLQLQIYYYYYYYYYYCKQNHISHVTQHNVRITFTYITLWRKVILVKLTVA